LTRPTASRDILADPIARAILIPGPPGTGLLSNAPGSATGILQLINAFPRDIAGLKPSREQLGKLTKAFNEFGDGAAILVDKAKLVVTTAETTEQILNGIMIAAGGVSIGVSLLETGASIAAGNGTICILKAATPAIIGAASFWAMAVDANADLIARKLNMNPENAAYLRWGARAVQVVVLVVGWTASKWASTKGNCFLAGTQVVTPHGLASIESLHPGQDVLDDAVQGVPGASPAAPAGFHTEVDPATWRQVDLRMISGEKPGGYYEIQLLEPLSWITQNHAAAGGSIHLSIPELFLDGPAQVIDIDPCPPIEQDGGRVVLGTFTHVADDVYRIKLRGEDEPVGVTHSHPFWSLDRGDWVPAGQLRPGERLATQTGQAVVESVTPDPAYQRVYNLDVEGEHRYLVTGLAVLAHNAYPYDGGVSGRIPRERGEWTGEPGESGWKSSRADVKAITGDTPIQYRVNPKQDYRTQTSSLGAEPM
jgi:hypothetical protein